MQSLFPPSVPSLLVLALFLLGCDTTAQEERAPEPLEPFTRLETQVVQTDNAFGLDLYTQLSTDAPDENLFISPLSVSMALGMTLNGARANTRTGMLDALQKTGLSEDAINAAYLSLINRFTQMDPSVKLNIANSIWYREGFAVEPAFLDVNQAYFGAEVSALDFASPAAKNIINAWVDDKTNGLIDQIVDTINPDDVMYLINAIYFKGTWTYEFDAALTEDQPFANDNGNRPSVPLMNLYGSVPYANTGEVSIIDLPYGDSLFSMTVVLPNDPAAFDAVASNITPVDWDTWVTNLRPQNVNLFIPRFKMEDKHPLNQVLTAMGMDDAFSAQNADFSGISAAQQLFISSVLHKTFVEVNEEGTEAAAVTSVDISTTSTGGDQPLRFRADRPFIFAIRERLSGAILFIGKVVNL